MGSDPRRLEAAARGCMALLWLGVAAIAIEQARRFGHAGEQGLAWAHMASGAAVGVLAAHRAFAHWLRFALLGQLPSPEPARGCLWTGQARVEGDQLVVRVSLSALPAILAGAPGLADEAGGEAQVLDLQQLAHDLARELDEHSCCDELDRTRFQVALDDALLAVVESGSTCVRLPYDGPLEEVDGN